MQHFADQQGGLFGDELSWAGGQSEQSSVGGLGCQESAFFFGSKHQKKVALVF